MTLESSGAISLGGSVTNRSVNLELSQGASAQISMNDTNVRTLAGVPSGAIILPTNFYGKSSVTFTPDGGTTVGTAVYLSDDVAYQEAQITISCSQTATWTYTLTSTTGTGFEFVSVASGGSSTDIIFELNGVDGSISYRQWSVSATSGGVTRYWTVYLRSEYV